MLVWALKTGRIAIWIHYKHNGKVWPGIATDKGLAPEPEKIVEFFCSEFEEMRSRAERRAGRANKECEEVVVDAGLAIEMLDGRLEEGGG